MISFVVSGPLAALSQVRTALAGAGQSDLAQPTEADTGLVLGDGDAFLSGSGLDVNHIVGAVASFGWVLRAHWNNEEAQSRWP